jgi:hypothetical protein
MDFFLSALSHTPLPTILVVAGIVFWLLAIAGSLAGKITVEPTKQRTAGVVGTALIVAGLVLFFVPSGSPETPTPAEQRAPTAQPAPSSAAQPSGPGPTSALPPATPQPSNKEIKMFKPGPWVDCNGTPDEVEVCANAELSNLDRQLHDLYQVLMQRLDNDQQAKLKRDENVWLRERHECRSNVSCIVAAYNMRISQLKSAR